ncbi:MAG: glucosamine-6-phosphate deaminase [Kiritimatiellae bacterium]|nr:glucosamine-6-phosphate deaminase [Kiritimatiellia bacterium]
MDIVICKSKEQAAHMVAGLIDRAIRAKPDTVLGLATGSTPVLMYKDLIRRHRECGLDFSRVRSWNLDEYVGLPPDHPASYRFFMNDQLFDHINIDKANTHVPDGMATDFAAAAQAYEEGIRADGGIDIQVLGIGSDGHIGFNEPATSLVARTHVQTLMLQTRLDNARLFFGGRLEDVPTRAITMGTGTVLDSRTAILMAFGKGKAPAVAGAIEGAISHMNQASALQMHRDAKFFVDEDAASLLKNADFYKAVYADSDLRSLED